MHQLPPLYIKPLDGDRKCFRCQGDHHVRDCPKKAAAAEARAKDRPKENQDAPAAKKVKVEKTELPAWRYLEPKDLKATLLDDGRTWKFCTKCKCKKSGRVGLYILSHFDHEHDDNYNVKKEGNLASVQGVPLGIPDSTVTARSLDELDDDIEFQGIGAWCTAVDPTGVTFSPSLVERENVSSSTDEEIEVSMAPTDDFDDPDGSPFMNALNSILQADPKLPTDWAFAVANEVVRLSEQNDGSDDHSDISDASDSYMRTLYPPDLLLRMWNGLGLDVDSFRLVSVNSDSLA